MQILFRDFVKTKPHRTDLTASPVFENKEPTSQVTGRYHNIMAEELPKAGIACHIIPRKKSAGKAISASTVRVALQNGDWATLKTLVPPTTYYYFTEPEAAPVLERIRRAGNVVHYWGFCDKKATELADAP